MKALRFLRVLLLALSLVASPVMASQATIVGPVTGPHTMADVMGTINAAFLAIQGCNSGSSAPANGPSAAPVSFEMWCDTTTNPVVVKMYDGASWVVVGKLNTSSHIWTPEYQGTDLGNASIATTGTSGHVVPFLDSINTISALWTFGSGDLAAVSPALTGVPTAPTASLGTNNTQIATTAYADAEIPTVANGHLLANATGGSAKAQDTAPSSWFDQAYCNTVGYILARTVSVWTCSNSIPVNITWFGADKTGTADSTSAIATAKAAVPVGGKLYAPAGSYLVSGTGTEIFLLTQPINVEGDGSSITGGGTTFLVASSVPTTRDIFHIVPPTNTSPRGFTFAKFNIKSQTGSPVGKNALHFDTTAGTTTNIADIIINQVYMDGSASAGGFSIHLDNGTGVNTNGGELFVTIDKSILNGGLSCLFCGDSLRLLNSQILTANSGFTIRQIAGAGGFLATGNNIVAAGGNIISAASAPVVGPGNEFEQQTTNTEANNAILDIQVATSPKVFGNSIVGLTGTGNPSQIRMDAVTGGSVENNFLGGPTTGTQLILTSSASAVTIGSDNNFAGSGTPISNSSTTTIYAPKSHGTALGVLGNAGLTAGTPYADIIPSSQGQVLVVNQAGTAIGWGQVTLGGSFPGVTGILPVANGGDNCATASGTCLDNITGFSGTGFVKRTGAGAYSFLNPVVTVKRQKFAATGTYTPTSGLLYADIEGVGGGGGGGGATGSGTQSDGGGGGGAGSHCKALATAATIGASQAVTIGAGGAASASGTTSGGAGGATSVGAICVAPGGSGGSAGTTGSGEGTGGAGGVASTGDIPAVGAPGETIVQFLASAAVVAKGGFGGNSIWGGGGGSPVASGVALNGNAGVMGGGGSGGVSASTTSPATGAAGGPGYVIVTEYLSQ